MLNIHSMYIANMQQYSKKFDQMYSSVEQNLQQYLLSAKKCKQ